MNRRVTTQDISWFMDLYRNEQLDLDPPYQRRSVWTPKDRKFFLDTIFRSYPSPSIFLHKVLEDGKTIYRVVDGKQRLETIFNFINNKITIGKEFGDIRLDGKKWKDVSDDPDLARSFWDYVLPVEFINVDTSSNYVNEVFDRLNRNSSKLVEQELRHAKYDGWFISFVERETDDNDWKVLGIVTTARTKRMRDVQFLSELLLVVLKSDISGFDQQELDEFYAVYDDIEESQIEVDFDKVSEDFKRARKYLIDMQLHNSSISNYAVDFKNFYTLWSLVVLHPTLIPSADNFANNYSLFMEEVNHLKDANFFEKIISHEIETTFKSSVKYYQASQGASTEEPQRRLRLEAMLDLVR